MKIDGIWSVEAYGYEGWEPVGTAFFDKGIYRAGGAEHYVVGSYNVKGRALLINARAHQFGKVRFVHGDKKARSKVAAVGKLKKNGTMVATVKDKESARFKLKVRYTRQGGL